MSFTLSFKIKVAFIILAGFFIISIITAISMYSIYQFNYIKLLTNANKAVKTYEDTFMKIVHDLKYLEVIDYEQDNKDILSDFKKVSKLIHKQNDLMNAVVFLKQFDKKDTQENIKEIREITNKKDLKIKSITKLLKESDQKEKNILSSVIVHREPMGKKKNVIGVDLATEANRLNAILNMNRNKTYTITDPVTLVNEENRYINSSVLYYPLYKKEDEKYYRWFAAVPFTYQKMSNKIIQNNNSFNNLHIKIFTSSEKKRTLVCGNSMQNEKHKVNTINILETKINIANKSYWITVEAHSLLTFKTFWQNILGFISGIFFLFFIGYYLLYKEKKNFEISKLRFRLLQAQKISSSGHCMLKIKEDNFSCSEGFITIVETDNDVDLKKLETLIYVEDKKDIETLIEDLKQKGTNSSGNITFRIMLGDRIKWLKAEYRVFYDSKANLDEIFIVIQDITQFKNTELLLKQNNEKFKKVALTDFLTGAYNRVYLDRELENIINRYARYDVIFSILILDIDHFKKVNDTYGHHEGDIVLVKFANLITSILRQTDIFARWGGEEFVVLMPNISKNQAMIVANKLRSSIESFNFSNKYDITCSIGVTEVIKGDRKESIFERTDKALYEAKETGRNKVILG